MNLQDLPCGTFTDKYKCLKILHTGPSGQVLLAKPRTEDTGCAQLVVKEFNCAKLDKAGYTMMLNEIQLMTSLRCPRIPQIMETFYDEDSHKVYNVMPHCSNGPVSVYIRKTRAKKQRVPERVIWGVLIGVLEALAYMDQYNPEKHCLHRSIKPDNILMDSNYVGVLTDFGISREKYKAEFLRQFCGSKNYLAPEMLAHKEYTESIDVWALGAVVYELCTLTPLATDALEWVRTTGYEPPREDAAVTPTMDLINTSSFDILTVRSSADGSRKWKDRQDSTRTKSPEEPVYAQEFINNITLVSKASRDKTPYSSDLHRVLMNLLQTNPKSRLSATMILAMPVVAAIRRYVDEPTNIVLNFLSECRDDSTTPPYKIVSKVFKNKTGTHCIAKKHTSGALFWAKEVRIDDDTGNAIVAAAHEHIINQRDLTHPAVIPCCQCIYLSNARKIMYVYSNEDMRFKNLQRNKPQLATLMFLDEYVRYQREQKQQIPEYTVWRIFLQLLTLLKWLHDSKHITLRYLSLETIFIDPVSHALKIYDFGLATLYTYPSGRIGSMECMAPEVHSKPEIQMGSVTETKLYSSPSSHHTYTNKCDMWSLGCVMYRMMTYVPFYSRYFNRTKGNYGNFKDIIFDNKFVFSYSPYSKTLETAVRLLLIKDPDLRYSSTKLLMKINLSWLEAHVFGSPVNIEQRSLESSYIIETIIADTPTYREFVLQSNDALANDDFSLALQSIGFTSISIGRTAGKDQRFIGRALRLSYEAFISDSISGYVLSQIKLARLLTDDCFVPVTDIFFDPQLGVVLVYKCHPDMSLTALCKQRFHHRQSFLEQEIWAIISQILVGMAKLHSFSTSGLNLGSIYLVNLTPDNIFVGIDGSVQILIPGCAQEHEQAGTLSAMFSGAIPYSAPEKLALIGNPSIGIDGFNEKNDIWALGCILYKLCSDGHSFYDVYVENKSMVISTKQTQVLLDGLIQWSNSLIEFLGMMLVVLPTQRPSADALLKYPYLVEGILPYVGSFPLALTYKKFDRRYLVLDNYTSDSFFGIEDEEATPKNDDLSLVSTRLSNVSGFNQVTTDTFLVQQMQQMQQLSQDCATTTTLKVTLKYDSSQCFLVKEFALNKLLPMSVREIYEVITAMRTLSMDLLETPVDCFVDHSYVYIITRYVHDLSLATLLQTHKERHTYLPERSVWKIAHMLLTVVQDVGTKGYAFGAISPRNIMLASGTSARKAGGTKGSFSCLHSDYDVLLTDYCMAHCYSTPFTRNIPPAYEPYLAPEVLMGKSNQTLSFSATSDLWAVGATLFEACCNIQFTQYMAENESVMSALRLGKNFKIPSVPYSQDLIELIRMLLIVDESRRLPAAQLLRKFDKMFTLAQNTGICNFALHFPIPFVRSSQYTILEVLSEDKENMCRLLKVKRAMQVQAPLALSMQRSASLYTMCDNDVLENESTYYCQEVKLLSRNKRTIHQILFLATVLVFQQHTSFFMDSVPSLANIPAVSKACPFLAALVDAFDDIESGCMCIVTEMTDEGTAADLVKNLKESSTGLTQTQLYTIADQLLQALERVYLPVPFYLAGAPKPIILELCHACVTLPNIMLTSDGNIKLNIFHALYEAGTPINNQLKTILGDVYASDLTVIDYNLDFWCLAAALFTLYTHKSLIVASAKRSQGLGVGVSPREALKGAVVQAIRTISASDLVEESFPIYLNHFKLTKEHASIVTVIQRLLNGTSKPQDDLFTLRQILNPDLQPTLKPEPELDITEKKAEGTSFLKSDEDSLVPPYHSTTLTDSRRHLRDDTSDINDSVIHRSSLNSAELSTQAMNTGAGPGDTMAQSTLHNKEKDTTQQEQQQYTEVLETDDDQDREQLVKLLKKKFGSNVLCNRYIIVSDEESSATHVENILVRPLNASIASRVLYKCHYIDLFKVKSQELRNAIILEVQLLLSFDHENIYKYIDAFYDKEAKKLCVISERVSDFTLVDMLQLYSENNTAVEEHKIWKCAEELISVLAYLQQFKNSAGQIGTFANLGITPSNIRFVLVEDAELRITTLKVCDFTCCVFLGDPTNPDTLSTTTAILASNDHYMCQDAIQTKYGYKKAYNAIFQDIWSVGAILYELATLQKFYIRFFNQDSATYSLDDINLNQKIDLWEPSRNYSQSLNSLITTMLRGQASTVVLAAMIASSETLQNIRLLDTKMPKRRLKDDYEALEFLCNMNISKLYKVKNLLSGYTLICKETVLTSMDAYVIHLLDSEMSILKQLSHENIAPLLDYFYDKDKFTVYLVTDFFQYGNVASLILRYTEKGTPIPEDTIWGIAYEALKGLEYLHSYDRPELSGVKIVHRNIRPECLFLTKDGKIHIFDFCLAKGIVRDSVGTAKDRIYVSAGTMGYMAPEVLAMQGYDASRATEVEAGANAEADANTQPNGYDEKCDIWSLGAVLYELCTLTTLTAKYPYLRKDGKGFTGVESIQPDPALVSVAGEPADGKRNTFYSGDLLDFVNLLLCPDAKTRPGAQELLLVMTKKAMWSTPEESSEERNAQNKQHAHFENRDALDGNQPQNVSTTTGLDAYSMSGVGDADPAPQGNVSNTKSLEGEIKVFHAGKIEESESGISVAGLQMPL